jgi:hypothetical protein
MNYRSMTPVSLTQRQNMLTTQIDLEAWQRACYHLRVGNEHTTLHAIAPWCQLQAGDQTFVVPCSASFDPITVGTRALKATVAALDASLIVFVGVIDRCLRFDVRGRTFHSLSRLYETIHED